MNYQAITIRTRVRVLLAPARCAASVFVALLLLTAGTVAEEVKSEDSSPSATQPKDSSPSPTKPDDGPAQSSEASTVPAPAAGKIQYVGPDTYILLDAEGRPQPVPGMTYEDFLAAWKKIHQAASSPSEPRFTIERIKIDGHTQGQRADLKFDATVHLLADGPTRVPLGLVGAILQGEARFSRVENDGGKEANDRSNAKDTKNGEFLTYDPDQGGFVARLNGKAGERRTLSLNIIVPLSRDGAELTLPLSCPRALTSDLALSVEGAVAEARTTSGSVVPQKSIAGGGTRIDVAGPAGQFRLTWQTAESDSSSIASVLSAVGAIRVTIDGRSVRNDARLTVRSFGGTFDRFRVRLPQGAKFIPQASATGSQDPKYRISVEPQAAGSTAAATGRQIVLVELKEKQQGPVVVELSTEQSGGTDPSDQALELGGFEVLNAVRQYGDIALSLANDWQARWDIRRYVRQVDPTELDSSLQRPDVTAAFQYDRQPWSLGLRLAPRQSRVYVIPQYQLELMPDEARLNVRLAYQVFGARSFEFRVDMKGWELSGEAVDSGGLVDQDNIEVTSTGMMRLPLAQASSRKAEVSFTLRRPLERDVSKLELPLPVPLADSVGTGDLVVRVAPEIELLPDLLNSPGIAAATPSNATERSSEESRTELHFRSLLPSAIFVASRANRSREESAQITAQIEVGTDASQVEQRVNYMVRYEPTKELIFEVPVALPIDGDGGDGIDIAMLAPAGGDTELTEQRTALRIEPIVEENESGGASTHRVRAILPQPQIGKFAVAVRYRIPRPRGKAAAEGAFELPLVSPVVHTVSERATVTTPASTAVSLNSKAEGSSWKAADDQSKENGRNAGAEFVSDSAELSLPLVLATTESKTTSTTIVERLWLQTWISGGVQQDRAAFQIRTSGLQTAIELPPNAPASGVEVLVDGQPADVSTAAEGRILVRFAPQANRAKGKAAEAVNHTVELRYRRPVQQSLITRHLLTPPQIDGATELSQIYWQVVLPADEHIVQSPSQLASASQWQWLGTFWGRKPVKFQEELEKWAGASPQIGPASNNNQYLFTGLLPVASISVVIAPRWLIVLVASAVAIAVLTSWLYLPAASKRWLLVAMIFVIAGAAIAYPTAALLLAQASAIGIVLASLSMLLSRLAERAKRPAASSVVTASSQRVVIPRTDTIVMPPVIASGSTAPTVSLRSSDVDR